ncbi:polysaccharide biosynthesis protein [Vibrio vulnificus]|uniref:polysaccharide biosynthesis protein n=1 Tax=Vibrio vulnificus TaxID=672 RepID=UPI001A1FE9C2|nr:nucleoside-diphosphate sugar epimerase/dehydratase [Vibrio vulnificus]MCG8705368.1 polysaccharide biosynthesis protein [Vibrio vulnificus]HAS8154959.1 polysaccharide biosynthesis protein [Vibrio vulnificus]HAU8285469.1 NAD-dependent epimerase/dehydratase family protein [Vibrio vulnificus]HDY7788683.1 polysaccharide biosynthesis protein [Vibrio vulnificus]HDY8125483.1 polysaccharide biosynthesis protein [Vibrio vulnificus]
MDKLAYIWSLPRVHKRLISLAIDTLLITFSFFMAIWVRHGEVAVSVSVETWLTLAGTVVVTLIAFTRLGLYRAVLRYLTFHALTVVVLGALISALSITTFAYFFNAEVPRTVPVIYMTFLALLCGGARMMVRSLIVQASRKGCERVLIYGAGSTGRQLAIALRNAETYQVKGFIDNDPSLENTIIQGLTVHSSQQISRLVEKQEIEKILLAMPRATRSERKAIIDGLLHLPVEVLTVPDFKDIVNGNATVDELKDVAIEDLLGRDPVEPNPELMKANIHGKVVMVTGAGGSIGSELCRQIVRQKPKTLILFELSEYGLYEIDKELSGMVEAMQLEVEIIPLLGSVQRINRLSATMRAFGVQTVYHAAAYKHVPLVEYNVVEGVRNNVFGTYYSAKAAIEAGVESFVLISTDKAVRPTNVMGTSKRMAELALQALAAKENDKVNGTRFCMVRFGNVLGSSGSVIPLFKRQIEEGQAITVTHPDIIRYFMTIPEAAQLVIQAGAMGKGGDVFVLDMGEPVKIVDLAKNLIQLSGLEVKSSDNPNGDIEIKFTGLRPGEKLYEELLIGDNVEGTDHERIMTANEQFLPLEEFNQILDNLDRACHDFDHETIRQILLETPTGFNPTDGIGDLVWNAKQKLNASKNKVVDLAKAIS